jgi:hypothetical protein
MIRQLKHMKDETQYCDAGKAVLEHHFDNHECCGAWCPRENLTEEKSKRATGTIGARPRMQRSTVYCLLSQKIERFITLDRLKEVAHFMDTQCNESFNNTAAWFAPKNKSNCTVDHRVSRINRLSVAIGISMLLLVRLHEYDRLLHNGVGSSLDLLLSGEGGAGVQFFVWELLLAS